MTTSTGLPRSKPNIASVSDLHLGHPRNKAKDIVSNLKIAFPDSPETAELDIIFIAGDVTDRLLNLPSEEALVIIHWARDLLHICKKYSIMLRILYGTPSHDWEQSKIFETVNTITGIGADLKYVSTLQIEHIDRWNIDVLYVPDEWQPTTEKTYQQVVDLMRDKGLVKVDYAVMHGQFEFQLPPFVKAQKHDSEKYLSLVRDYIFIGHVHIHSTYKRIIAQGSFDRISHGEEAAKGHVRVYYEGDVAKIKFIKNKGAKVFRTVVCTGLSMEETYAKLDEVMRHEKPTCFIRIEAEKTHPVFSTFNTLIARYPLVTWTKLARDETEEAEVVRPDTEEVYTPITITKENISSLMMDRIRKQSMVNDVYLECERILTECL